jgi:hypothetical protein
VDADSNRAVHINWTPAPQVAFKPELREMVLSIDWFQDNPSNCTHVSRNRADHPN